MFGNEKCDGPTVEVDESKKLLKIFVIAFITCERLKPFETIIDHLVFFFLEFYHGMRQMQRAMFIGRWVRSSVGPLIGHALNEYVTNWPYLLIFSFNK